MSAKRVFREPEPIAELFGDVIRDGPSSLFGDERAPDAAARAAGAALPPPPEAPPPASSRPPIQPDPDDGPRDAPVVWRDDKGLLSGVVVLHGALTVLTLGIWRFWMKTEQRLVVWSHTTLDDEPLEWTGRGSELLLGLLIAVVFVGATMATAQVAALWLGFAAAPLGEVAGLPVDASFLAPAAAAVIATPPLLQYAAFRARRYRLSRTRWKGLAFSMDGSGLSLVGVWLMWLPAVVLSAGLFWPFWRWARERHMTRCMRWGEERFGFVGSGFRLWLHWLPFWLGAAGMLVLALVPGAAAALGPFSPAAIAAQGPWGALLASLAALFAAGLAWLHWRAAEIRLTWRARRLAGAWAECRFSAGHLADAWLTMTVRNLWPGIAVWVLAVAAAALPLWSAMRVEMEALSAGGGAAPEALAQIGAHLSGGFQSWRAQGLVLMGLALSYGISTVFAMWLWTAVHARRAHALLCSSLHVHGLDRLDAVRRGARRSNADAEGLADAMDAGGAF